MVRFKHLPVIFSLSEANQPARDQSSFNPVTHGKKFAEGAGFGEKAENKRRGGNERTNRNKSATKERKRRKHIENKVKIRKKFSEINVIVFNILASWLNYFHATLYMQFLINLICDNNQPIHELLGLDLETYALVTY